MAYRSSVKSDMPFGAAIVVVVLVLAAIVGWILNIVKAFGSLDDPLTAMFIARVVGVFAAPLGAVLGWL